MKNTTDEFSFILKPSTIPEAGVGVFALHDVAKGARLDLLPEDYQSRKLSLGEIPEALRVYCVYKEGGRHSCPQSFNRMYMAWYLNHSKEPNAGYDSSKKEYRSIRDIQEGE